jgi:hypothetical protein
VSESNKCGSWGLQKLDDGPLGQQRWVVGEHGPRAYITTDEDAARLIAAAPDLLAFARECARGDSDCGEPLRAAARAAIAKAEGR